MQNGSWTSATEQVLASAEARAMAAGMDSKEGPRAFVQKVKTYFVFAVTFVTNSQYRELQNGMVTPSFRFVY